MNPTFNPQLSARPAGAVQREFTGFEIPVEYQLLSLDVARVFTRMPVESLMYAITEGLITWAFDIRCKLNMDGEETCRPCVRVLRSSLLRYAARDHVASLAMRSDARAEERELIEAVKIMFPKHQTAIASALIDEAFLCSENHRQHLLWEQSLRCVVKAGAGPGWKPGPGGMGLITRESVLEFLKSRRIP